MKYLLTLTGFLLVVFSHPAIAQPPEETAADTLVVIWSSGDPEVAEKVCFMYTHAARKYGWFDEVILIVWGPSARLLAENESLQKKVQAMQSDGVIVEACVACARMYGVDDDLKEMGIDVKGMGSPLTHYLKSGYKTLNF